MLVGYVLSLRGSEIFLLNLGGLNKYNSSKRSEVVLSLLGKVKGESNTRMHFMYSVPMTSSGINVRKWIELLMLAQRKAKRHDGPASTYYFGAPLKYSEVNDMMIKILCELWDELPDLFPAYVTSHGVILER